MGDGVVRVIDLGFMVEYGEKLLEKNAHYSMDSKSPSLYFDLRCLASTLIYLKEGNLPKQNTTASKELKKLEKEKTEAPFLEVLKFRLAPEKDISLLRLNRVISKCLSNLLQLDSKLYSSSSLVQDYFDRMVSQGSSEK